MDMCSQVTKLHVLLLLGILGHQAIFDFGNSQLYLIDNLQQVLALGHAPIVICATRGGGSKDKWRIGAVSNGERDGDSY